MSYDNALENKVKLAKEELEKLIQEQSEQVQMLHSVDLNSKRPSKKHKPNTGFRLGSYKFKSR